MTRIPEPEALMSDVEQCRAYNIYASNFNNLDEYVNNYKTLIGIDQGTVIDLGSGSCNFVIALANAFPKLKFICYENSDTMIQIAHENINQEQLSARIQIIKDDIINAKGKYDVVLANRVLHHIDDTQKFWDVVDSLGNNILIIDMNRPPEEVVKHIQEVDTYEYPKYKEDLINSMRAAYSLEEVQTQIKHLDYIAFADQYYRLFVYQKR